MNSYKELIIKAIDDAFSFEEADKRFNDHPEFVDVKSRFCEITVGSKRYVVKKCKRTEAENERNNALLVKKMMKELSFEGIRIEVVVPELFIHGGSSFLVSPYLGQTLEGAKYLSSRNVFPKSVLFSVTQWFFNQGIIYRGFLPRNTFFPDSVHCYLIDFEEVVFLGQDSRSLNLKWETNYLLNWGYFFNVEELQTFFRSLQPMEYWVEPPLNTYEVIWANIIFQNEAASLNDVAELKRVRQAIEQIVLHAERPFDDNSNAVFFPNDCAHLVADLFGTELDVFFDTVLWFLEECRKEWIGLLSGAIISGMAENCLKDEEILLLILAMVEAGDGFKIPDIEAFSANSYKSIISYVERSKCNSTLLSLYADGKVEELEKYVKQMLKKRFTTVLASCGCIKGRLFNNTIDEISIEIVKRSKKYAEQKK